MPAIHADATVYLAAAIGCLRSVVEMRGVTYTLREEVERKKVELEKLLGKLREMPGR